MENCDKEISNWKVWLCITDTYLEWKTCAYCKNWHHTRRHEINSSRDRRYKNHSLWKLISTIFTQMQDRVFPLKFGTKICEDVFNSGMRCQTVLHKTGSLQTGPCRADTRPASPNCHERFELFRDITQHRLVIPYLHFGATYQSNFQRLTNQNERKDHDWG